MPFVTIKGLSGKLYVPDDAAAGPKKHRCRDCFSCQNCGDDRCEVCRQRPANASAACCRQKKPSS